MKPTLFTAIALAGLATVSVQAQSDEQAQSDDAVSGKPAETKISKLADEAEFGAGYTSTDGEKLYKTLCAGCHMPDGSGAVGAGKYPALKNNAALQFAKLPVSLIVNGQGAMPPFGSLLDNKQIVAVTSYIQANLGNGYEPNANADMVESFRPEEPTAANTAVQE